jgi:hypothetical protein
MSFGVTLASEQPVVDHEPVGLENEAARVRQIAAIDPEIAADVRAGKPHQPFYVHVVAVHRGLDGEHVGVERGVAGVGQCCPAHRDLCHARRIQGQPLQPTALQRELTVHRDPLALQVWKEAAAEPDTARSRFGQVDPRIEQALLKVGDLIHGGTREGERSADPCSG